MNSRRHSILNDLDELRHYQSGYTAIETALNEGGLEGNDRQDARSVLKHTSRLGGMVEDGIDDDIAMMRDLRAAVFATVATDRFFRPAKNRERMNEFFEVLDATGVPGVMSWFEGTGLTVLERASRNSVLRRIASIAVPLIERHTINKLGKFVLFDATGDPSSVHKKTSAITNKFGIPLEVNNIMESADTQEEADENRDWYIAMIELGEPFLAVKPTAIVPMSGSAVASKHHQKAFASQLTQILKAAYENRNPETGVCTQITVDMESTDTHDWTVNGFNEATGAVPEVSCGIALQAYMPDTYGDVDGLVKTTHERIKDGYPELWARLVKGANISSEEYNAMAHGMIRPDGKPDIAMFDYKWETDAHYFELFSKILSGKMGVVIASMNDLTIIHCLMAAERLLKKPEDKRKVVVSMLRGLGGEQKLRILANRYGVISRIYTPVASTKKIVESLAYYLRRGDELGGSRNGSINYTGDTAKIGIGSPQWIATQGLAYTKALKTQHTTKYPLERGIKPNRGIHQAPLNRLNLEDSFRATPDANFSAKEVRDWHEEIIQCALNRTSEEADFIATNIGEVSAGSAAVDYQSLTRPELVLAKVRYASKEDADQAVESASLNKEWANTPQEERREVLYKATTLIHEARDILIESMMLDTDKPCQQADAEINEAIDFGRINDKFMQQTEVQGWRLHPKNNGVGVVICPWNFPVAIPYQHIIALLAGGNRVIVKPAPESVHATYKLCELMWKAGIPKSALQFVPCDNKVAQHLASNPNVSHIGFTGSTATAQIIREANPSADFVGETGGVNVVIVTGSSDLKEVAKEIIVKGMGFSKQKCSGVGYVIVTDDVDRQKFYKYLIEMAKSLKVGSSLETNTDLVSLIRQPHPDSNLYKALTECKKGESWLLKPENEEGTSRWSAGIKLVSSFECPPEQWEEVFAALINIVHVADVKTALEMQRRTNYGLTGGIFSFSEQHQQLALENMGVGNLYINKTIVGARAGIEDFGDGRGLSHIGMHGIKTGTMEFLIMHSTVKPLTHDTSTHNRAALLKNRGYNSILLGLRSSDLNAFDITRLENAVVSYFVEAEKYFGKKHSTETKLSCEDNYREFEPSGTQVIRATEHDNYEDIIMLIFAGIAAGNKVELSIDLSVKMRTFIANVIHLLPSEKFKHSYQFEEDFIKDIANSKGVSCVHALSQSNDKLAAAVAKAGAFLDKRKPTGVGQIDMITQYRQRSVTNLYGRFGDEGLRKLETEVDK